MSYADPYVLVSTDYVQSNLLNPNIRIVEVDYDPSNYYQGHIPNAVLIDWRKDMNDPIVRDIIKKEDFEKLMSRLGISNNTEVILYGDFNNWFAAFAFWVFKYYGHKYVRLLNGGRKKWIEEDRPLTKEIPKFEPTTYKASDPNEHIRTYFSYVYSSLPYFGKDKLLVDVRSPKEFTGEVLAPPEYPNEGAQRGGHIPKAINIPWSIAVKEDGTFKSYEELKRIYEEKGITSDKEIITYCRIGERAAVTWFVLTHLLGYKNVKLYDGSWTEWGSVVRVPIEK
ncbi:MAG: sulfurtransferase [Thermoproteota archaeon]|jgi:Rhodanese-related sulfurtransferase